MVVIAGVCLLSGMAFIGLPSMPCCLGPLITRHVLERFVLALQRPGVIEVTIDRLQ